MRRIERDRLLNESVEELASDCVSSPVRCCWSYSPLVREMAYVALWFVVVFALLSAIDYFRAFRKKVEARDAAAVAPNVVVLRKEDKENLAS